MKKISFDKSHPTTKATRQKKYGKTNECLAMILARLYSGETLSQKALADECGVSLRTMQRYVNEKMVGFPIRKRGDSFSLACSEREETALNPEERAVLEMLDELSRKQGHGFYEKAHRVLKKLKTSVANPYFARLDMEEIDGLLSSAVKLERAIKKRRVVHCRYKMDGGTYDIAIKPLKIANFQGYWYVVALDARNDTVKKYLLRHIFHIRSGDEGFEPPEDLDAAIARALAVWFEPGREPIEIRLFIDGEVAKYFERKPLATTQTIVGRDTDGSLEVVVKITHEMEIVPVVKQWLPHVRVLEPAWLDERIRKDIAAYMAD
jgi:predicted DNA-binding transcriptional regulator YafY